MYFLCHSIFICPNLPSLTGDMVEVVYDTGTDTTPLYADTSDNYNGFTGFRI